MSLIPKLPAQADGEKVLQSRRDALKYLLSATAATALLPASPALLAKVFSYTQDQTETFLQLSSILTGELKSELDTTLALEYMQRLESRAPGVLDRLLTVYGRLVKQAGGNQQQLIRLVEKDIWQPRDCKSTSYGGSPICDSQASPECCLARDIPLLWYSGALMEITTLQVPTTQFVYGSAASYLGALAWKTGMAHPQAQCGGTYGYWSVKPGKPHKTGG
jgi:hypothetical protein